MVNQRDRAQTIKQINNSISARYGKDIVFSEIIADNPEILGRMSPDGLVGNNEGFADITDYLNQVGEFLEANHEAGSVPSIQEKVRFWFSQFAEDYIGFAPIQKDAPTPDYTSEYESMNNLHRIALYEANREYGANMNLLVPASRTLAAGERNNNKWSGKALARVNEQGGLSIIAINPVPEGKKNHFTVSFIQVPKDKIGNFKINKNGTIGIKNPQVSSSVVTRAVSADLGPVFEAALSLHNEMKRKEQEARLREEEEESEALLDEKEQAEQEEKDKAWEANRERKHKHKHHITPSFEL